MENLTTEFQEALAAWGPSLIAAVAVLLIGWWLARLLTGVLRRMMSRASVDPTLTSFVSNLAYMGLMALVVISASTVNAANGTFPFCNAWIRSV